MLVIVWEVFWLFWIISTWVDCFCPDIKIHKSQRTIFSNLTVFKSTISNRKPHKADLSGWSLPLPLIGIILFHLGAYEPCYSQGQCWHRERLLSSTDFRDDGVETAVTMSKKNQHIVWSSHEKSEMVWTSQQQAGSSVPQKQGEKKKPHVVSTWKCLDYLVEPVYKAYRETGKSLRDLSEEIPQADSDQTWMTERTKSFTAKRRRSFGTLDLTMMSYRANMEGGSEAGEMTW